MMDDSFELNPDTLIDCIECRLSVDATVHSMLEEFQEEWGLPRDMIMAYLLTSTIEYFYERGGDKNQEATIRMCRNIYRVINRTYNG